MSDTFGRLCVVVTGWLGEAATAAAAAVELPCGAVKTLPATTKGKI